MSWDIVLFNSNKKIDSIENFDVSQLGQVNFSQILEDSFTEIVIDDNHREIKGHDYSIDYFADDEPSNNFMLSLYGENGLYELIELAKQYGWQIFDTGLGEMIDLDNPENNGFVNYKKYVEQIIGNR